MKKRVKVPLIIVGVIVLAIVSLIGFKFFDMMQQGVNIVTGEMVGEAAELIEANKEAPDLELDYRDMFSEKDLVLEPDMGASVTLNLESDKDIILDQEGLYLISGEYTDLMIVIDVEDKEKVQLVFDDVTIVNESKPVVYVKSGDKVFITTTDSKNKMSVTSEFIPDGATNLDAVIFSKSDIVINGIGTLTINSEKANGISSKDDLKITGGILNVKSLDNGLEANDSIRIYDGDISLTSSNDAIHSENNEDDSLGYIYVEGGIINITATDDAIRGNSAVVINGGTITIENCTEGLEASQIIINDGVITINSDDDGINATFKTSYRAMVEINGGVINIKMASGDTDGVDSNGDFTMNGGELNIEGGMAAFDIDGNIVYKSGDVFVDGSPQSEIIVQEIGLGLFFNR